MERLLENQFAYKVKDFIFKFRKPIAIVQAAENPVEPQFDENGRASVEYTGNLLLIFDSICMYLHNILEIVYILTIEC